MDLIIAANWKMHKTAAEAAAYCCEFLTLAKRFSGIELVICPSFTLLPIVRSSLEGSAIKLGAQNMFWADCGAYTGEIAPAMLKDCGVEYVILGHSERRHLLGEDDLFIRRKIEAALIRGLKPILCIGETEEERDQGKAEEVLEKQLFAALSGLEGRFDTDLVVAYEPVWAIGSGRAALPEDAEKAALIIRRAATQCLGREAAQRLRIQYGGSVKADNIGSFMALPSLQGALVGGASLEPAAFAGLIAAAGEAKDC